MDVPGYIYGSLVAVGGSMGYFKAGSTTSLVSGLGFGSLIIYGASRVSRNAKDVYLSLFLSTLLLVVMGVRYTKSGKFMPAGLISLLSFVMTLLYAYRLIN